MRQPRWGGSHPKAIRQHLALSVGRRDRIISIASPLALLLLWEIAVRGGLVDARFFPAPSRIRYASQDCSTQKSET